VEWKLCHCMMVEAHIHLRLLLTYILDMYKVFEVLVCWLTGIWVHLHHSTSQVGHILCFFCHLGGEMIQLHHSWGSHPPQTASHINIRYTKFLRYWYAVLRAYGCTLLYHSIPQIGPRFLEFWVPCACGVKKWQ
jgi:hypothetical protein